MIAGFDDSQKAKQVFLVLFAFFIFIWICSPSSAVKYSGEDCSSHSDCADDLYCHSVAKKCTKLGGMIHEERCSVSSDCESSGCLSGYCTICYYGQCIWEDSCTSDASCYFGDSCVKFNSTLSLCMGGVFNYDDNDKDGLKVWEDCDDSSKECYTNCDLNNDFIYDNADPGTAGKQDYDVWDCKDDYVDKDGDGSYGVPVNPVLKIETFDYYDCDDNDPEVYSGPPKEKSENDLFSISDPDFMCDFKDNDCDGVADECSNKTVNGISRLQRCNYDSGKCEPFDGDGDGYENAAFGGSDCDDNYASVHPGAVDGPHDDDNCNGIRDDGGDYDDDGSPDFSNSNNIDKGDRCIGDPSEVPDGAVIDSFGCPYSTSNGNLVGWSATNNIDSFVVQDPGVAKEGKNYLYVKGESGSFLQYIGKFKNDTVYTFSFWYAAINAPFGVSVLYDNDVVLEVDGLSGHSFTEVSFTLPKTPAADGLVYVKFRPLISGGIFYLDSLQLEPAPEPTPYVDFKYEYGCCPEDYCWSGEVDVLSNPVADWTPRCIQDDFYMKNVSFPAIGSPQSSDGRGFDLKNGFRCINSSWKFSRVKFAPLYDHAGFCPDDNQCYVYNETGLAQYSCVDHRGVSTVEAWQKSFVANKPVTRPETFYCYMGNWTTRTKAIALQLMEFTGAEDTYSLFCDDYRHALNSFEDYGLFGGYSILPPSTGLHGVSQGMEGAVGYFASGAAEEFCVLRVNDRVIAGVSLNINISSPPSAEGGAEYQGLPGEEPVPAAPLFPYSFIELLTGDKKYCDDAAVDPSKDEFNKCKNEDVWYNAHLNAVIFSKTEIPQVSQSVRQPVPLTAPTKSLVEKGFDLVKQLFNRLLSVFGLARGNAVEPETAPLESQIDFVRNAGDFDKLYISSMPEDGRHKVIKGVRETRYSKTTDDFTTFMSVEYLNYKTDICSFFNFKIAQAGDVIRHQISDSDIHCNPLILNDSDWVWNVYVEMPKLDDVYGDLQVGVPGLGTKFPRMWTVFADNFWNDLTAKIRSQPAEALSPDDPSPKIDAVVALPLGSAAVGPVTAGSVVNITPIITENLEDNIARTWYFGDNTSFTTWNGFSFGSWSGMSAEHVYEDASGSPYTVTVYVMNKFFKIDKETTSVEVKSRPYIDIETIPFSLVSSPDKLKVKVKVSGGSPKYNVYFTFGDTPQAVTVTKDDQDAGFVPSPPAEYVEYDYFTDPAKCGNKKYNLTITVTDEQGVESVRQKEIIVDYPDCP
jgi:hypothetical protein